MDQSQFKRTFLFSLLLIFALALAACNDRSEGSILRRGDVVVVETPEADGAVTPITEDVVVQEQPTPTVTIISQEATATPTTPAATVEVQNTPAPASSTQDQQAVTAQNVIVKASTLLGIAVETMQGDALGSLADLVVDTGTGQIPYAILASSGLWRGEGETILIPFSAFALSQRGNALLLPFVNPDQLAGAPIVSADWPTWGDLAWADRGIAAWGQTEYGQRLPAAGQSASALRISNLINYGIGAQGELGSGSIADLLIDLQGNRARWLVVDYAENASAVSVDYSTHMVLIPFVAMDWQNLGQEIFFAPNIDATAFGGAPLILRDEFTQAEFLDPNFDSDVISYWEGFGLQFEGVAR